MSNNKVVDPCGHIKLSVSDFKKGYAFYNDIFEGLGYKQVKNRKGNAGWASPGGYGIWVAQAKIVGCPYKSNAPGIHHLCLKADSTEKVDQIYHLALEKGAFIFDAPQKYSEYTDKYYAVFFADPDGIKIEVAYY